MRYTSAIQVRNIYAESYVEDLDRIRSLKFNTAGVGYSKLRGSYLPSPAGTPSIWEDSEYATFDLTTFYPKACAVIDRVPIGAWLSPATSNSFESTSTAMLCTSVSKVKTTRRLFFFLTRIPSSPAREPLQILTR